MGQGVGGVGGWVGLGGQCGSVFVDGGGDGWGG